MAEIDLYSASSSEAALMEEISGLKERWDTEVSAFLECRFRCTRSSLTAVDSNHPDSGGKIEINCNIHINNII